MWTICPTQTSCLGMRLFRIQKQKLLEEAALPTLKSRLNPYAGWLFDSESRCRLPARSRSGVYVPVRQDIPFRGQGRRETKHYR